MLLIIHGLTSNSYADYVHRVEAMAWINNYVAYKQRICLRDYVTISLNPS